MPLSGGAHAPCHSGNLYYYNATTGQSSRQHPLDEYYMHLYLKLKMQRKMEVFAAIEPATCFLVQARRDHVPQVAGMGVPDEIKSRSTANLTTEDLKRMRAQMAAKMEGEVPACGGLRGGCARVFAWPPCA